MTVGEPLVELTAPPAPSATTQSDAGSYAPNPTSPSRLHTPVGRVTNGAAIVGTLTASGRSGGFDLNVWLARPGAKATCDGDTQCTVQNLPGGSTLAVGTWHDPSRPAGTTYQVELVRSDGADILMHVSNESSPKGDSIITAPRVPLTLDQMIAFVTSHRW